MFGTLFGGALAIAALFFALRWTGASVYWRAVVATGLPLLAYLTFALIVWPGLDVVAIHLAVFIALGAVLALSATQRARSRAKLHWAPKLLIGFFVFLFMLNSGFIYLSSHGLPDWLAKIVLPGAEQGGAHTAFPGVVPHSDDAAKGISSHLKQQYLQAALGWQIELQGLAELQHGRRARLNLRATDRNGAPLTQAKAAITLLRPAQENPEKRIEMVPVRPGVYEATAQADPGEWTMVLRVTRGADTFEARQPLTVSGP